MKLNFGAPFYLLIAISLFIVSCSKQGPAGPAGPAGPQGPAGSAGAAGAQGAQGNPGTANVIYSNWIDTVKFQGSDSTGWFAGISAPQLVDSIINTGEIKVYLNYGSDSADNQFITPLPTVDLFLFGGSVYINPYFSPKFITLASTSDVSSYTSNNFHHFRYRYILIPGGTPAGRNPKGTINWNNYAEVKKYLGLKD
jgi:hypothetical protein